MNRRNFLINSSLAGVTLSGIGLSGCVLSTPSATETSNASETAPTTDAFRLNEKSIRDLQIMMQNGELTSRQITQLYLDRIAGLDKSGPKLNAVMEINPDALRIADAMDKERRSGKVRGPMHGIPFMVKDNIDTADQMSTSAGALALANNKATNDAFIIAKLRQAGAVLLGKTNLSEWANFRSTKSASGWSARGGQTKNAYVTDRTPCGSSSGSGVAVAANFCAVAIGTETNGSVVCPAAVNGLVGLKPTVGLVSRTGIIPISHTQDTAGPMARTVTDAAILLSALVGYDPADATTSAQETVPFTDYTKFLDKESLQGKRIGVEKSFLKGHYGVDVLLQNALDLLKSKGTTIVEVEIMKEVRKVSASSFKILQYEFKAGVNKYLATANAPVKTLADVIAFNQKNAATSMPFFQQEILEMSEKLGGLDTMEYQQALEKQVTGSRKAITELMDQHKLDAICGPTYGPSWCIDLVNGDSSTGYGMSTPAALSGYPHITVPMGQVQGLPIGFSFIGKAFAEPTVLAIAFAYEQASKHRTPPTFRSSTNP